MLDFVFVMSPRQNLFFHELVDCVRFELAGLGIRSTVSLDGFPPPRPDLIYALVPPHEYFALESGRAVIDDSVLSRTVFISAEQPDTVHFDNNVRLAQRAGAVFDINLRGVRGYQANGIRAHHLRLGYTGWLDRFAQSANSDRDVVFLGCLSPRRLRYLASYGGILTRLRHRLILSDNSSPNDRPSPNFVAGEEKLRLLGATKALINIHQDEEPYFEWLRVLEAIHCGCVVISEHSTDSEPLIPGAHFLSGRTSALGYLAEAVAEDEPLRRRLRRDAYDAIRSEMPLSSSVTELATVADALAAQPARIRKKISAPVQGISPPGDSADLPIMPISPYPVGDRTATDIRRALKDVSLRLLDLRREALSTRLERAGLSPRRVDHVLQSVGSRARPRPRVSVITALYNHASQIPDALQALAAGTYDDFEVIVVDDGSTDSGLDAVRDWSNAHPDTSLRLLSFPVNRGLPHARNAALDLARGEYVFVLDADNAPYPDCLASLVAVLDADPGVAFAYGALAVFDGERFTRLISCLAWDPARLRLGNYIDAMALFRTRTVREMHGYAPDPRLHGWEDYDLYCRLAESGYTGRFTGEIVALYRESPASMSTFSNLSITSAFAALKERAPQLMAGVAVPP